MNSFLNTTLRILESLVFYFVYGTLMFAFSSVVFFLIEYFLGPMDRTNWYIMPYLFTLGAMAAVKRDRKERK